MPFIMQDSINYLYIVFIIIAVITSIFRFFKAKNENDNRPVNKTKKPGKLQKVFDYLEKEFDLEQPRGQEIRPDFQYQQKVKQEKQASNYETIKKQKKAAQKEKSLLSTRSESRIKPAYKSNEQQENTKSSFTDNERIKQLTPLKKAIILSEILSPPKALR